MTLSSNKSNFAGSFENYEILGSLCLSFAKRSLGRTSVLVWRAWFKAGRVSVQVSERSERAVIHRTSRKNSWFHLWRPSSNKIYHISSLTWLEIVTEFAIKIDKPWKQINKLFELNLMWRKCISIPTKGGVRNFFFNPIWTLTLP